MLSPTSLLGPALLGLVLVAGHGVAAAVDHHVDCGAASAPESFAWTVSDFWYNTSIVFSTPAHQIDSGLVQFNLTNPAVAQPALCRAYSSQLSDFFYGSIVYNCTAPADGDGGTAAQTTFTFNAPTRELAVNQTWACPGRHATFAASGALNLTLACAKDDYVNPNWTMGQIYSSNTTTCSSPPVTLAPHECGAEA